MSNHWRILWATVSIELVGETGNTRYNAPMLLRTHEYNLKTRNEEDILLMSVWDIAIPLQRTIFHDSLIDWGALQSLRGTYTPLDLRAQICVI